MTQPFIVSAKLVVDNSQGIRPVEEERRAIENLGRTIRQVSAGPQVRIDQMLGIGRTQDTARRAADIAAYGAGLDDLRAKFNPLFEAERNHTRTLEEIASARRVGAINAEEESAAILREKAAYDQLTASIVANQNGRRAQGAVINRFNTANVAAQFQDIAVTSAMGMSPLQIALQQGTQLAAVLGEGGAAGAAKTLGSALLSLVNPVSLLTIGGVAAGAAMLQWLGPMLFHTETATAAVKRHREAVLGIVEDYEAAEASANEYFDRAQRRPAGAVLSDLTVQFREAQKAREELRGLADVSAAGGNEGLTSELREVLTLFDEGTISARELYSRVIDLRNADLSAFAFVMRGVYDSIANAALKAGDLYDDIIGFSHIAAGLGQNAGVQVGLDSFLEGQRSAELHKLELDAINAKSPAQQAEIARRRTAIELRDEEISDSLRQQKIDEAGALAYAQAARSITDSSLQRLRAANDNVAAAQMDLKLIGKSVEESERLRFVRQQLAAAEMEAAQTGIAVTEAYRQKIEELGAAYGKVQSAIALQRLQSDIAFQRSQLFRSDSEQQIATQLRAIFGDDVSSVQAQFVADQLRVNESLSTTRDLLGDVSKGFLSDLKRGLMEGTSLFETIGNAGVNALSRIGDKALDYAGDGIADLIFGAIAGGLTGGSVGGSAIGSIGRSIAGAVGRNARGTDNWTGGLTRIHEEGGEVIDLPRGTRIIPHDVSMEMARAGGDGAGIVFAPVTHIDATGSTMEEARFEELLDRRDRAWKAQLPQMMRYLNANPRREALPG